MPLDPIARAKAEATAARDLARLWDRFDLATSAEDARARMDAALDRLIDLRAEAAAR